MHVLRTTIFALVLGSNACVVVPSSWIVPEAEPEPQASPVEVAAQRGRIADSWSLIEYEEQEHDQIICPLITISVFLADESMWVGLSTGSWLQFGILESGYDWASLTKTLEGYRETADFVYRHDIQIAAADKVQYHNVVTAMDLVIAADFTQLSFVVPKYLDANFTGLREEVVRPGE